MKSLYRSNWGCVHRGFALLSVGDHYLYDLNGNLTNDKNKNLTITYNHLNLPTSFVIKGASGLYLQIFYLKKRK
jgi:hypothetical protein